MINQKVLYQIVPNTNPFLHYIAHFIEIIGEVICVTGCKLWKLDCDYKFDDKYAPIRTYVFPSLVFSLGLPFGMRPRI